jgi:hypothetical protein
MPRHPRSPLRSIRPPPLDTLEHPIYTCSSGTSAPAPPCERPALVPARVGGLRGRRPPGASLGARGPTRRHHAPHATEGSTMPSRHRVTCRDMPDRLPPSPRLARRAPAANCGMSGGSLSLPPNPIAQAAANCGMPGRSLSLPALPIAQAGACCGMLRSQLTRPATCLSVGGTPPPVSRARETPPLRKTGTPTR